MTIEMTAINIVLFAVFSIFAVIGVASTLNYLRGFTLKRRDADEDA